MIDVDLLIRGAEPYGVAVDGGRIAATGIELAHAESAANFASKAGQLAANHFATLVEGQEQLRDLGRLTLWQGAQPISFREIAG